MKTIELQDEECWSLNILENAENVRYFISDEVYEILEIIIIFSYCSIDFPIFEGLKLNAPNLKMLCFDKRSQTNIPFFGDFKFNTPKLNRISLSGVGSLKWFQDIHQNANTLMLEDVYLDNTGITEIPDFILRMKTINKLTFRHEDISELPDDLFDLENLIQLNFQYCSGIKIIPDHIKKLVNLEHFDLWGASIQYLSPELFLLPKLEFVNFAYTYYIPAKEVVDAFEIFNKRLKKPYDNKPWVNH
jgi:hypothetical protein